MTKPIGPEELARIVDRIGWPPSRLAEITGADLSGEIAEPQQIRNLRALALCPASRLMVARFRVFFPELKLEAIRVFESEVS